MRPIGTTRSAGGIVRRRMAFGCVLVYWAHGAWRLAVLGGPVGFVAFCVVNPQRIVLAVRGH